MFTAGEPITETELTWTQHLEVSGARLVHSIQSLVEDGNVRDIIIRRTDGTILIEVPLYKVNDVPVIPSPTVAALGALAALVSRVHLEVVRVDDTGLWGTD